MKDVYNHILLISTVAAIVMPIVLLIMNFFKVFAINCSQANTSRFVKNPVSFFFLFLLPSFCIEKKQTVFRFCLCMLPLTAS